METVRDHIRAIQAEVGRGDVLPTRGNELLMRATALLGNVTDEIRAADAAYASVLLVCLDSEERANRAKIRAEITPEFQRRQEARDTKDLLRELIASLKYFLRSQQEEMRLSR